MSQDIGAALEGWQYDPESVTVRIIVGDDGREKVQLRLDLGLLQMEVTGRPDGQRPHDCESWLDHYEAQQRKHDSEHPDGPAFQLGPSECTNLLREGIQYYHRYLSFWHLDRYAECARDTARNLRLFRFVHEYARRERDKLQFDQFRPYVTLMHTRAVATPLVNAGEFAAALESIDRGIGGIQAFLEEYEQTARADQCRELVELEAWRREVEELAGAERRAEGDGASGATARSSTGSEALTELPAHADPLAQLKAQLESAVAEERFEDAARLRDEIHRRSGGP